jgi:hypothetical protein
LFGLKNFEQLHAIQHMVADLDVEIVLPIVHAKWILRIEGLFGPESHLLASVGSRLSDEIAKVELCSLTAVTFEKKSFSLNWCVPAGLTTGRSSPTRPKYAPAANL